MTAVVVDDGSRKASLNLIANKKQKRGMFYHKASGRNSAFSPVLAGPKPGGNSSVSLYMIICPISLISTC
jgi:hypothetical protein